MCIHQKNVTIYSWRTYITILIGYCFLAYERWKQQQKLIEEQTRLALESDMSRKLRFAEGERVLCFHGPLIYEAKALKSTITKDKQVKYYIHYAGWNKNWDEWVPENRVLKYNDANVQRQREVSKLHSSAGARNKKGGPKGKRSDGGSPGLPRDGIESRALSPLKELLPPLSAPSTSGRGRSRSYATSGSTAVSVHGPSSASSHPVHGVFVAMPAGHDETHRKKRARIEVSSVESEDRFLSRVEVKLKMPDELKPYLVDDWDAVNRQLKLLDIPANITVQNIIDSYVAFKKSSKSSNLAKEIAVTDVANGLIEYFNVMLGSQLLYKFERYQYLEVLKQYPGRPMCKIYGGFHLLRLFVRLGSMLAFTTLDEKSLQTLQGHLNDFLKFLVKNSATYFSMSSFVNVTREYYRVSQ